MKKTDQSSHKPIPGLQGLYEITRDGEVFSTRSGRFIKHRTVTVKGKKTSRIEVSVNGLKQQLRIGQTIADTYLSDKDREMIIRELPAGVTTLEALTEIKPTLADALAKYYKVNVRAILSVMRSEFDRRNGVEKASAGLILVDEAGEFMPGMGPLPRPTEIQGESPSPQGVSVSCLTVPSTVFPQLIVLQAEIAALAETQPETMKQILTDWAGRLRRVTDTSYPPAQVSLYTAPSGQNPS